MALSFGILICVLGTILLPTISESQRRGTGTNCLKSTLPRNVKNMFDSCVQKAKNECSGSSNNSDGSETCSIPKSWTKLCPCMIEEIQKIFGSCCNTTNSCNRTIEKTSVTCVYNKSTEVLSSFYTCCGQLNSFWYRRLNKVLFMALKDFLQRKYGTNSGIQTSSRTIQAAAAQEICADLSESEFVEANKQPYNCSTSERILQATHCTFHSLMAHLQDSCDKEDEENYDKENDRNSSSQDDNSSEIEEECESLSSMMYTRWVENLTMPCDAVSDFQKTIHAAMSQDDDEESSESTTMATTTRMASTRRPNRMRNRNRKG